MSVRRIAAIALGGALILGGSGAAIAAVTKDDGEKAEQAILDDAAKRLNVAPDKLRDALAAAQDAQLDQAVKDGKLTQKQADAIKARRKASGHVLGGPGVLGGREFHAGPGFPGKLGPNGGPGNGTFEGPRFEFRGGPFADLADALGITHAKLMAQLRAGKSIAAIAKAQGKSLADVRAAMKAATKTRLDKAVKDGDLTQAQADKMLEHLTARLKAFGSGRVLKFHRHFRGGPPRAGKMTRPGAFVPGEDMPDVIEGAIYN